MRITFLDANTDTSEFGRSHSDEAEKFRALFRPVAPGWVIDGYKLCTGDFPSTLEATDGMVL